MKIYSRFQFGVDSYNVSTWEDEDFVLVHPYPFNAAKRVWIDQDVIESPHCIFILLVDYRDLPQPWPLKRTGVQQN